MSARGWLGGLLLLLVAGAAGFAWVRAEGGAPSVQAPESLAVGADGRALELVVADPESGLRSLQVALRHARGEAPLVVEEFAGTLLAGGERREPERVSVRIDPKALGAPEGEAFLHVVVRDWSWRGALRGNATELEIPVRVDLKPPRVNVRSGLTYVRRGGAGAVVYRVGEPSVRDGVRVGDALFEGFAAPDGSGRVALFAVPTDATPEPEVRVFAQDAAGNLAEARWPAVVQERELPHAVVELPRSFLESKVRGLASAHDIPIDDLAVAFQRVNEELRAANEARIRELVSDSAGEPLWDGAFEQLRNSQVTSRFAERRTYRIDGEPLSEATHFGFDLASTQASPITAANAGRVIFAGELGIYGNCVLIDHGLGLASLYGHLSRLDVAAGDRVDKGATLGLSGATGLAGGDHLHFAILVGGRYVDPLEWWDPEWVRTHVEARLAPPAP